MRTWGLLLVTQLSACHPAETPVQEPAGIELRWLPGDHGAVIDLAPLGGTARIVTLTLGRTDERGQFHGWRAEGIAGCSAAAAGAVRGLRYGEAAACLRTIQLDPWRPDADWQLDVQYDVEPGVRPAMIRRCPDVAACPQLGF
ncbi:hypothetical protein [Chitinilyticum piscinae]|uniref:Uncharacterized protein n=1 Tax=Chitinilyticum piscinae TaxID=2866724 RepID=A0A8J7K1C0_9NEIS|nr:hypothetical protein [Chitinilyticum piscinae]MBE9608467.1 hypothetical protein [Chitinilyticum piscinae]